jgi:hypothetical protein
LTLLTKPKDILTEARFAQVAVRTVVTFPAILNGIGATDTGFGHGTLADIRRIDADPPET